MIDGQRVTSFSGQGSSSGGGFLGGSLAPAPVVATAPPPAVFPTRSVTPAGENK